MRALIRTYTKLKRNISLQVKGLSVVILKDNSLFRRTITIKNSLLVFLLLPEGKFALEVVNHIIERNSLPYGKDEGRLEEGGRLLSCMSEPLLLTKAPSGP